jgi:cyclopropane-fatty-acyl-phospholipid synthase
LLEVGPGWGGWFAYASGRGIKCAGISISRVSIDYLTRRARELDRHWELIYSDLLAFSTEKKYDAVVIMGVIESLPQYDLVLQKCLSFVKPGGRIFIDGSAGTKKYEVSTYISKFIFPGNHSFLVLHDFLEQLARTPLKLVEVLNDRMSYFYTFQQWARNFDANRETVVQRFGDFQYRRFRLYLWGAAYEFLSDSLDCYRMIIEAPKR